MYWAYWGGKNGYRITPAQVTSFGPYGEATDPVKYEKNGKSKYDRIVNVGGAGIALTILKGHTERESRIAFGFEKLMFWTTPLTPPAPPKSHGRKRKAK